MADSEPAFDHLVAKPLAIVRRAADMLVLHFGTVLLHPSGRGTVGEFALHIQCPWRFENAGRTVTGSADLRIFDGIGFEPESWNYEDGSSVQDARFSDLFGQREGRKGWLIANEAYVVCSIKHDIASGDIRIAFAGGHLLSIFPAGSAVEAWRLFCPGDESHIVFPPEQQGISG